MSFTAEGVRVRQKAFLDAEDPSLQASGAFRVEFDVSQQETHRSTAKVTTHPVETGAEIADHVQQDPDVLTLQVQVSNTPIVSETDAFVLTPNRAEDAYETLRRVKETPVLVTVLTTLREYRSMVITELTCTRDAKTGDVAAMSLTLQSVRTATSQTVAAPTPRKARGNRSIDGGKEPTTDAPAAVDEKSQTILERFARRAGF